MRLAHATFALPLALICGFVHSGTPRPAAAGSSARPLTPSVHAARPFADPGLVLSEVLPGPARDWDGSGAFSSRDDEWVEVRNAGAAPISLAGYFLTDADSIPRYAFSGSLEGHGHWVLYGSESFAWERANARSAVGLSLANSGDAVLLWQVAGAETVLVDSLSFRSHVAAADRSLARRDDTGPWELFDGLNPYTGTAQPQGNRCNPTPETENACAATSTRAATWGKLKSLYR